MTIIVNCLLFWFALATGPLLVLLAVLMSGHKPEPRPFYGHVSAGCKRFNEKLQVSNPDHAHH